jgi:hypothetical protein
MEDGNYEVKWRRANKSSVVFDAAGNLMMTKGNCCKSLPAGCTAYVSKNYPGVPSKPLKSL